MSIERILILEDDNSLRKCLEEALRGKRFSVFPAQSLEAARQLLARETFDVLLTDLRLPDGLAIDLLKELQARPQRPLVIVMTGHASVESAVECMRNGAFEYLVKPFSLDQLDIAIEKAGDYNRLVTVNKFLSREAPEDEQTELLGDSAPMQELRQLIRKVARTEATVLIQGESGTGKELIARAIYRESSRANAPFIRVNCAAVPENLIESEFFGHEKGAFTGALNKREGRFELAHGGTILLDEISEISPNIQAKLLRVLQEREFERIGGNRTIKVDVRIIATTNRNLQEWIDKGQFRQDLFFRLNVVPIHVAPLREKSSDIAYLAGQFVERFSRKHGVRVRGLSPESMQLLQQHSWPGNVREMQNVVERAVILCGDNQMIEPHHLGMLTAGSVVPVEPLRKSPLAIVSTAPGDSHFLSMSELERHHIMAALARCHNNRTHAAKLLDISVRTLRNKLNEYNGKSAATVPAGAGSDS
ncbi:MAG TPA: sigma-54 dependent transcriptional regulator [Verrucomicrobiae bacterium]|nr:sigma-54 dependent transcriptional regulator [Verrucomicrobiae bacterium]